MSKTLTVALYGAGPIGQRIARMLLDTDGVRLVGAADVSASKSGQDLGTVMGLPKKLRVKIEADPMKLARKVRADVSVVCTSSQIKDLKPLLAALVKKRSNVITTCEQLAFPTPANLASFKELDKMARAKKVSILATGVNPGFAMDALALTLTAPCATVERVTVTRVVDASTRRMSLQRKVGAGLNVHQFRRAVAEGHVQHVGLAQSAHMIAAGLGWKLDKVEESIDAAIAPRDLDTEYLRIPAGATAGIKQHVRGYRGAELAVNLDLQMYVGAESPRDHILIEGNPRIDMTIHGGIAGDVATAALVVNCLPGLLSARAGLITMLDLPLIHSLNQAQLKELVGKGVRKR
jgi:4-hydroxy-tetrahydrodipicolinate reductase